MSNNIEEAADAALDYAEQIEAAAQFDRAGKIAADLIGESLAAAPDETATIQSDARASYGITYYAQTVMPALILTLEPLLGEDEAIEDVLAPVTATVINHTAGGVVAAAMARQMMEAHLATMPPPPPHAIPSVEAD